MNSDKTNYGWGFNGPVEDKGSEEISEDFTGQQRFASNVVFSWGGYMVFFVAGFIMPRMIDRHVGQFSLGIWDFSWSLVNYLNLAMLGIGSSVNRYVAKYRAASDVDGLRKAISSVVCIQIIIALCVLLTSAILSLSLPLLFLNRLGSEIVTAQWVIALLGTSLAIQMGFDAFRGVITGCHRWDLYNILNAGSGSVEVILMISALMMSGGLISLALIYLCVITITELIRMIIAMRICPEMRIRLKYVGWTQVKKMILFGLKTIIADLSPLVIIQTTNIIVAGILGPASLAIFARPVALVRHAETFINKFAYILTPTAGALHGRGEDLRDFLIETTRYSTAFALPMYLFLIIFGDLILELWMGPQYSHGLVIAILASGYFIAISQNSVLRILMGMNLHGRIGLFSLIVSLSVFGAGSIVISIFGWNLIYIALLVALSLSISRGILVPVYACIKLDISLSKYLSRVFFTPSVSSIVFALCLYLSRIIFPDNIIYCLIYGSTCGSLALGLLYWRYLLSASHRIMIIHFIKNKFETRR